MRTNFYHSIYYLHIRYNTWLVKARDQLCNCLVTKDENFNMDLVSDQIYISQTLLTELVLKMC